MPKTSLSAADIGIYALARKRTDGMNRKTLQYVWGVDHFRDPIGHASFKGLDGRDPAVQTWIMDDVRIKAIIDECKIICHDHVDQKKARWVSLAFEDYHGKWISAAIAEVVASALADAGYKVAVVHDWSTV